MSVAINYYLQIAAPYIALGALLISLIAVGYAIALKIRLRRLALGRNGSFEESLQILTRENKELKEFRRELEKYLKLAEGRLRGSVQGIGVVRFNPFVSGQGGNQSFAAAFLDERGCGVVFSTLYSRDRGRGSSDGRPNYTPHNPPPPTDKKEAPRASRTGPSGEKKKPKQTKKKKKTPGAEPIPLAGVNICPDPV